MQGSDYKPTAVFSEFWIILVFVVLSSNSAFPWFPHKSAEQRQRLACCCQPILQPIKGKQDLQWSRFTLRSFKYLLSDGNRSFTVHSRTNVTNEDAGAPKVSFQWTFFTFRAELMLHIFRISVCLFGWKTTWRISHVWHTNIHTSYLKVPDDSPKGIERRRWWWYSKYPKKKPLKEPNRLACKY